ncbi:DUF1810 domain-containing protein [Nocardioides marmoraquaticus]
MDGLERFVLAQEQAYDDALGELRRGRKTGHWMWFVLPQLRGLGRSPTAQHFGIVDLDEARAYLDHPVLGSRLRECCQALLDLDGADAESVLGPVDAMKLRSCVTLFARADPDDPLFPAVLDRFFDATPDPHTTARL